MLKDCRVEPVNDTMLLISRTVHCMLVFLLMVVWHKKTALVLFYSAVLCFMGFLEGVKA